MNLLQYTDSDNMIVFYSLKKVLKAFGRWRTQQCVSQIKVQFCTASFKFRFFETFLICSTFSKLKLMVQTQNVWVPFQNTSKASSKHRGMIVIRPSFLRHTVEPPPSRLLEITIRKLVDQITKPNRVKSLIALEFVHLLTSFIKHYLIIKSKLLVVLGADLLDDFCL